MQMFGYLSGQSLDLKQHTGRNKGTLSEECLYAVVVNGVLALVQGSASWLACPSAVAHVSFEQKIL